MSYAMRFEEYLRQQVERGQFGVAMIESEIALGIADWIELHRDSVPVVRCRDCKWWREETDRTCSHHSLVMPMKPSDYCLYGERKAAESE